MRNAILSFTILCSLLLLTSCGQDEVLSPEISYSTVKCIKGKYNYTDPKSTPVIVWEFTPNPDFLAEYFHNSEPLNSSWCMPQENGNPLLHKNFRQLIPELPASLPYGKAMLGDTIDVVVKGKIVERIILYIPEVITTIPNFQSGSAILQKEYIK